MLRRENILYPEEFFPHASYSHNDGRFWLWNNNSRDVTDWPLFYNAWEYIQKFRYQDQQWKDEQIFWNLSDYNFSIFQSNDSRAPWTRIGWYIKFHSIVVNNLIWIPPETPIKEARKKVHLRTLNINDPIWILRTEVMPDADFMVSINFQDTPIGFLGFDIESDGNIKIKQIQWTNVVDQARTFFSWKHHALDGFDWRSVLVTFFEDYLRQSWFQWTIVLQSSENNQYFTPKEDLAIDDERRAEQEKRNKRLLKHYNPTAKKLWYKRDIILPAQIWNRTYPNNYSKTI